MTQKARHRLHMAADLKAGATLTLDPGHSHYLANVLRLKSGDGVRLFNATDGEWLSQIIAVAKKAVTVELIDQLREPAQEPGPILAFAPIKKARMDFLIEKAVELGASALQPVLTHRTQGQKLNYDRLAAQVVEASEQSERLTVPEVKKALTLAEFLDQPPALILFADEARDGVTVAVSLAETDLDIAEIAFLIGPEGGFAPEEREAIRQLPNAQAVTLGPRILRAETAALAALVAAGSTQ